ncbi:MAG: D-TA family PLP-dependent enzyme [Clostridia bacterium]|nr:D-TA family PLP-dependent enzyme [Clostridia bacterium]
MFTYHFENEEKIPSPALIYYKDLIEENTKKTISIAGTAERLWPHVKTHKMAELVQMQVSMGIVRFKCATVSEIRMVAENGGQHILWAYPLIGPNVEIFVKLAKEFSNCKLYALADDISTLSALSKAAEATGITANLLLDVNMGMNRTGISIEEIESFYTAAKEYGNISLCGLHCYDGHIHDNDFDERTTHASSPAERVYTLRSTLLQKGYDLSIMIMGGTPTFPCHAKTDDVFLSPGTIFVSDSGYRRNFPDIDVIPAAAVMTRVISHPDTDLFTLDTGTKAVSADANPRGILFGLEEKCDPILSSEEHWVFRMRPEYMNERPAIGDIFYVIPTHICPTTAMYDAAYVCENGRLTDIWKVAARERIGQKTLEEIL